MKNFLKIVLLFSFLSMIFIGCGTENSNKKSGDFDFSKIEKDFISQGFERSEYKPTNDDPTHRISFVKEIDKFDQLVDFYFDDSNNIREISVISQQFHLTPDYSKIKDNLKEVALIIEAGSSEKEFNDKLTEAIDLLPTESSKNSENKTYKTINFKISTMSTEISREFSVEKLNNK